MIVPIFCPLLYHTSLSQQFSKCRHSWAIVSAAQLAILSEGVEATILYAQHGFMASPPSPLNRICRKRHLIIFNLQ